MEFEIAAEEAATTATELEGVQVSAHSRDWLRNGRHGGHHMRRITARAGLGSSTIASSSISAGPSGSAAPSGSASATAPNPNLAKRTRYSAGFYYDGNIPTPSTNQTRLVSLPSMADLPSLHCKGLSLPGASQEHVVGVSVWDRGWGNTDRDGEYCEGQKDQASKKDAPDVSD